MSAITIRKVPEEVHDALRRLAREHGQSVESFARDKLAEIATRGRRGGIDFDRLRARRAELGWDQEGPAWSEDMDGPELSRRVLGLED